MSGKMSKKRKITDQDAKGQKSVAQMFESKAKVVSLFYAN
jgi:hypothetical protein